MPEAGTGGGGVGVQWGQSFSLHDETPLEMVQNKVNVLKATELST